MSECLCKNTAGVRFNGQDSESLGLGRSTSEAVLNGALMAAVSVIERVVSEFESSKLVLTGGDADRVSPFLGAPHVVEPDLLLSGLRKYFAN
jgi:pantothenate kinase type III